MMTQTLAILHDAYRELNAKRLFWFTLLISGVVVAAFAGIGNNDQGIAIFGWTLEFPPMSTRFIPRAEFYKLVFVNLGLGVWLTWLATILALVSTASIFPDFLAGGAIELSLSKPIGRLRLFLTKYAAGLLFVALQVTVFTAASFLVIGIRGGEWVPAIFLAIPLVVLVFSYLFSICVFFGTLWRSTIAALMLTLLAWGLIFMANGADATLLTVKSGFELRTEQQGERVGTLREQIRKMEERGAAGATGGSAADADEPAEPRPTAGGLLEGFKWAAKNSKPVEGDDAATLERSREKLVRLETRLAEMRESTERLRWWHGMVFGLKTGLPKTGETVSLMERYILDWSEMEQLRAAAGPATNVDVGMGESDEDPHVEDEVVGQRVERVLRGRTELWVIGTSLAFEAVVLGLAAWIFCRRDF